MHRSFRHFVVVSSLFASACPGPAKDKPSLLAQAKEKAAAEPAPVVETQAVGDAAAPTPRPRRALRYEKRKGLHIDVPFFADRRWEDVSEAVRADQIGTISIDEELPGDERHIVGSKAELWLWRGRVYRIRKPLEHPMDIPTALGTSGFPLTLGGGRTTATDVRWDRYGQIRRLRLIKSTSDATVYDTLEAWAFFPKEVD